MKYVLDSSVALKVVLLEQDSDKAETLMRDFQHQLHALVAPDVFPVEIAHTLTKAERRGLLKRGDAIEKLEDVLRYGPEIRTSFSILPEATTLSSATGAGVYDCLYVVLAEREGCEFITADEKLKARLPNHPIRLLSTFP